MFPLDLKNALAEWLIAKLEPARKHFEVAKNKENLKLVRTLKEHVEEARILVRQRRDDIWKRIQNAEREGEISEDQKFFQKEKMEKLVEKTNDKIAALSEKKEREIMEV